MKETKSEWISKWGKGKALPCRRKLINKYTMNDGIRKSLFAAIIIII